MATTTTILSTVAARPPGMGGLALTRVARAVGTRAASRRVAGAWAMAQGAAGRTALARWAAISWPSSITAKA